MRVAIIKAHGGYDAIQFEDHPLPEYSSHECLIRIRACGLNHLDTWVRRGVEGHRFPLPLVPGSDITGTIEKTGAEIKKFKSGDRVIINPAVTAATPEEFQNGRDHLTKKWGLLGETQNGGCQEFLAVPENQIHPLPSKISFEQGACIPVAYVTAWQMLLGKAKIQKGESILIHGAGSGVSIASVQIAKQFGLQVFVTSSSDQKLQQIKLLGADRFIHTKKGPFLETVKNLTNREGVDVVVDHIGAPTMMESIRALKKGGRLVSCGATAGANITIDWKHVFFKNISLMGSTYGPDRDFRAVLDYFQQGRLTPIIDSLIKLEDLPKAHARLESRDVFGKIIVRMND